MSTILNIGNISYNIMTVINKLSIIGKNVR